MQPDVSSMTTTQDELIKPPPRRWHLAQTRILKTRFDLALLAVVLIGFVCVASQYLSTAPLPDTDESMTLQVPYEMLYHGKLALPMYRHLGGNIENVWHSYTPVFFLLLSGFMKLFGWGLEQGRVFNLLTAVVVLAITHAIGRRLFDWRAGLAAVVLLVSDPTFIDRSRVVRNDFAGAMFALLAFYLYELATERKQGKLYFAAGMAAGAGVMCHTNVLYILAAIGTLMVFREGLRIIRARSAYQFLAGAFAVMAYEIIHDILDYKNFLLQNRQDDMHFGVLNVWGWLSNLLDEPTRYARWYNGFLKVDTSLALLHCFLWLSAAAIIYLLVRCAIKLRSGSLIDEPRARLFVMTAVIALFFAIVTQRKVVLYVIHLAPWLALSVGVMMRDGLDMLKRLRTSAWPNAKPVYLVLIVAIWCGAIFYAYRFASQNRDYLRAAANPQRARFDELAEVFRSVVPDDVCPVGVKQGVLWLAFPEKDYCFAAIENRMREALDIKGNEYALIASVRRKKKEGKLIRELTEGATLIAELKRTAYGTLSIYYTGTNPAHLSLAPARYTFFGKERGYASEAEIDAAREIWAATADELNRSAGEANNINSLASFTVSQSARDSGLVKLCSVELDEATIYQLILDTSGQQGRWEVVITDDESAAVLYSGKLKADRFADIFKTKRAGRIAINVRHAAQKIDGQISISRVSLREVAPVLRRTNH
jgi:4-amino-4-deoxy-L-arabinose transferase-like glycosyltransferase